MNSSSWLIIGIGLVILGLGNLSQARVFNVKDEQFAAYVRGTLAPLAFENTLNSGSHGTGSTLDSSSPYNLAGEFGFIYGTEKMNFRFGLEVIHPPDKKNEIGSSSSGVSLFSLTSELSVVAPKLGIDFTLTYWNTGRVYTGLAVGYASLAARNSYSLTTAGTAQYSGLTEFDEDLRAGAPIYEGLIGFETLFNDTTTLAIEAAYRNLMFKDIKHNKDGANFQGSFAKGDPALNDNGSNRTLNLSQFYFAANCRFWIF